MTIDDAVSDIVKTYADTPEHLTGPPLVNWLPLLDESVSEQAWLLALRQHPRKPSALVRAHNARARACRAADIAALAAKYQVSQRDVRRNLPRVRVASATGGEVPSWGDAWRMVRAAIGPGPHTAATVKRELEAVGRTNVHYHLNTEAYPWWVTVKVTKRTACTVKRAITIGTGEIK